MATKGLIMGILLLPAGCAMIDGPRPPTGASVTVEEEEAWRSVAAEEDAAALDALPGIRAEALADARRAGFHRRLAEEGALLAPAAALPRAAPPPGAYLCRVIRLGVRMAGVRPWSESAEGFCFVGAERDQLSLTIEAGPRRIGGYLWEEKDNRRLIFLGTAAARGTPLGGYGDDRARNAAGLFERIGPFRYRLTLPWRGDNRLAIVELSPAPEQ
ncbi:MAG: hypothetical protein QOH81_1118 [Sphingomonadales bacterium]|nr:hypothetical protein [Sphingomonadales bacterium]